MSLVLLAYFLLFCSACLGASLSFGPFEVGPCPVVNPLVSLDMTRYLGKWVEVAKFPLATSPLVGSGYGPDLDCVISWYDNENTGSIYRVTNTGVKQDTGERVTITGMSV